MCSLSLNSPKDLKQKKAFLKIEFLFSEMIPRTLRASNIDIEGYALGLDITGQLFVSATTSNYSFPFVDSKYTVCTSNTIFLKTNLNNIAVTNNDIVSTNIIMADDEGHLSHQIGRFQGIMPDGELGKKIAILSGFEGEVLAFGLKDSHAEQNIVYGAFSSFLRSSILKKLGNTEMTNDVDKNINTIDVECVRRFLERNQRTEDRGSVFAEFKQKFIANQITSYTVMNSSEEFYRGLTAILA